jgi:hypothetical protein
MIKKTNGNNVLLKTTHHGICIHYSGKIKNADLLPKLISEVKDIAETYHWPYHIFETEFPEGSTKTNDYNGTIYGICFTPPDCETIDLCFLYNGRMSSELKLQYFAQHKKVKEEIMYYNFAKTQLAGIELHQLTNSSF